MTEELRADVVIVGSGMGGGTLAWALAERGVDVLVVERGERLPREAANWSPEEVFAARRYKPDETWLDDAGREFHPGVHYVVGGNTKVYGASLPRLRVRDFERTDYPEGVSPAWPFAYADLEPYYADAERRFLVHGATGEDPTEPWRSAPFPFPALAHEPYVEETAARLRAHGLHPSPTAMGIDLRPGGACIRCATCDGFPCRLGAKADAETCGIDPALRLGARLVTGVRAERIDVRGGRAVAVTGVRAHAGGALEPVRIEGGTFVLAAGAVNSAALWLRSGIPDASGMAGRNYMVHHNTHLACVDPRRRNDVVFQKTFAVNDWYDDLGDGLPGGTVQLIGKVQGSMMATHATRVPKPLLDRIAARSLECLVMSEDTPSPANRVTLNDDGRIVITWQRYNYGRHEALLARARQALRSAGYAAIFEQRFGIEMNSHMCGTLAAGDDPATSVVDGLGRAHAIANLRVADASAFPSSGAQNPALTIAAMALRMAAEADWA